MPDDEAHCEDRFGRMRYPQRRLDRGFRLSESKAPMVEKHTAGFRHLNTAGGTKQQLHPHFAFEVTNLPTEGRLRGMQASILDRASSSDKNQWAFMLT